MVLADDGSGTGTKVAKYYVDSDGNYFELYSYVLFSASDGVLETATFPLKVTLGSPANPGTTPPTPETPNNVNPQDLVAQINTASSLIYAAFGASSPGQPPAYLPIQVSGGAARRPGRHDHGAPGFDGYAMNVLGASRQPVQVSQTYVGAMTYPIAGTSRDGARQPAKQKPVPFYGSISHGLDRQVSYPALYSADGTSDPAPDGAADRHVRPVRRAGLGALIGTPLSFAFQGSGAIPPQVAGGRTPGTTMKADDSVFYTVNASLIGRRFPDHRLDR